MFPLNGAEPKLWAHLREPPPRVSSFRDDVPGAFDEVVWRALAKAPPARFDSAPALAAAALAAATAELDAGASTAATPQRGARELPAALAGRGAFVGRAHELTALARVFDETGDGRARLVLVTGEAGIGKSALVARAVCGVQGVTVLYGRCDEQPLEPYQPVAEMVRDLVARVPELRSDPAFAGVARIVPDLAPDTPEEEARGQLFGAAAALLDGIGSPLLFVVDDLHWADQPTLLLLRALLRRVRSSLVVVATSRDAGDTGGPVTELAVELRRDGVLEQVRLDGLGEATATALIANRASTSPDPGFVHWVLERTDGNPFFIEELLRGNLDVSSVPDQPPVPEGVMQHVVQRLGRLSTDTAEALRIARGRRRGVRRRHDRAAHRRVRGDAGGRRGSDRERPDPRGPGPPRPVRVRARARARRRVRDHDRHAPCAPAPAHRRGDGGGRIRRPGGARTPLPAGGPAGRPRQGRAMGDRRRRGRGTSARLRGSGRPLRERARAARSLRVDRRRLALSDPDRHRLQAGHLRW